MLSINAPEGAKWHSHKKRPAAFGGSALGLLRLLAHSLPPVPHYFFGLERQPSAPRSRGLPGGARAAGVRRGWSPWARVGGPAALPRCGLDSRAMTWPPIGNVTLWPMQKSSNFKHLVHERPDRNVQVNPLPERCAKFQPRSCRGLHARPQSVKTTIDRSGARQGRIPFVARSPNLAGDSRAFKSVLSMDSTITELSLSYHSVIIELPLGVN